MEKQFNFELKNLSFKKNKNSLLNEISFQSEKTRSTNFRKMQTKKEIACQ